MDHYERPPACATDPYPIPDAQSPWSVAMASTCSGARPVIIESCMDPETGATWEREIAELPTTHTARPDFDESGFIGNFNEFPERFELHRSGNVPPEDVLAIAGTMAAAPVMLGAIDAVLRSFAYAPGAGPEWFEACRAAHALATTSYVPTPDINRA